MRRTCGSTASILSSMAALAIGLAAIAGAGEARAAGDADLCKDFRAPPDAQIAACGRLIAGKKLHGRALAETYLRRGRGFNGKDERDRALADFDQAISLAPDWAEPYVDRGTAYTGKGDLDRAVENFDRAIRLDPKSATTHQGAAKPADEPIARQHVGLCR
jgi:lipoprotein NlpI